MWKAQQLGRTTCNAVEEILRLRVPIPSGIGSEKNG